MSILSGLEVLYLSRKCVHKYIFPPHYCVQFFIMCYQNVCNQCWLITFFKQGVHVEYALKAKILWITRNCHVLISKSCNT